MVYGAVGSGAEGLLGTVVYSLACDHGADEFGIYVIDLGSELLGLLSPLPQVGDVALSGEDEKVARLLDMLEGEVERRRRALSSMGVGYAALRSGGGEGMPAVLLVLNGVAAFSELYERLEPRLVRLVREGPRVGISTLLCATAPNEARLRLRQGLKQQLVCSLANQADYLSVFSSMRGVAVPHGLCRGLVELGKERLTFQGAFIAEKDGDERGVVEALARRSAAGGRTRGVRLMPEHVRVGEAGSLVVGGALIVGLYSDNLDPVVLDTLETPLRRAVYTLPRAGRIFVSGMVAAAVTAGIDVRLADCGHLLDDLPAVCVDATSDCDQMARWLWELSNGGGAGSLHLVIVTDILTALAGMADRARASEAGWAIGGLKRGGNTLLVLVDSINNAGYVHEGWYMAHQSASDGIWLGSGADSQTMVRIAYGTGDKLVGGLGDEDGYVVVVGRPRRARFISLEGHDEDE